MWVPFVSYPKRCVFFNEDFNWKSIIWGRLISSTCSIISGDKRDQTMEEKMKKMKINKQT